MSVTFNAMLANWSASLEWIGNTVAALLYMHEDEVPLNLALTRHLNGLFETLAI